MKHLLLLGACLCWGSGLWGQSATAFLTPDQKTTKFQTFGLLGTLAQNQDQKLAQTSYSGWGVGLSQGDLTFDSATVKEYQMQLGYERLQSPAGISTQQIWTHFSYQYLFKLGQTPWTLGPVANIFTEVRITNELSNNFLNWNLLGSLGIGAARFGQFPFEQFLSNTHWYAAAQIPLVSYLNRPNYALTFDGMDHQIGTPGWINRMDIQLGLLLPVRESNPNRYRISYGWQFFHHRDNEVQQVISGRHTLSFAFLFNTL